MRIFILTAGLCECVTGRPLDEKLMMSSSKAWQHRSVCVQLRNATGFVFVAVWYWRTFVKISKQTLPIR